MSKSLQIVNESLTFGVEALGEVFVFFQDRGDRLEFAGNNVDLAPGKEEYESKNEEVEGPD